MTTRTNPAIDPDHGRTARNAAVNMSMLGIESGGVMIVSDRPDAVPRVTVNLAALVELVERAKNGRVIFSGDENGMRKTVAAELMDLMEHSGRAIQPGLYTAAVRLDPSLEFGASSDAPEPSELRLIVGDKFHTVTDGGCHEVWTYAGCREDEYLIVQTRDGQEYTRVVELVGDTWRCVDDPDEFVSIVHVPANN